MTGRDAQEKRNRKRRMGQRPGHIEGLSMAGSRSRNVVARLKKLRTRRPKRPEKLDKTAVCRAGTAGQRASIKITQSSSKAHSQPHPRN